MKGILQAARVYNDDDLRQPSEYLNEVLRAIDEVERKDAQQQNRPIRRSPSRPSTDFMAIYSLPVINDVHLHQYNDNSSENSSNVWNYSDQDSDSDHGYDSYNNLNDTVTGQNRRYPDNGFQFHMDTIENTSITTSDSFFNPLPPNDFSEYDASSEGPSSPDSIYGGNNEIKKPIKDNRRRKKFKGEASQPLTLWEYILMNLIAPESKEFVKWSNEANGEFIINDSKLLAESWGIHKCKQPTTYENLSRSLRYYYGEKILEKVQHRRLMYRFIKREQFNNSKQRYLNLKRKRDRF